MANSTYRTYSSTARSATLANTAAIGDTSITVSATTGFPGTFPYTLVLEEGTTNQEVVTVTAASGSVLTVTRGEDGTSAVQHLVGSSVTHSLSARDYAEPRSAWTTFSPTIANVGSLTSSDCAYLLVGKTMCLRVQAVINAVGSGAYSLTLPAFLTAKTAAQRFAASKNGTAMVGAFVDTTHIKWVKSDGSQLAAADCTTGDVLAFTATIELA